MDPTPQEAAGVARALRSRRTIPVGWEPVTTGGHTPARRWVVRLEDRRTVFAKVATDELTASWLRDEHVVYSVLRGSAFMPAYVGWYDDGSRPVLILENLSAAAWAPPWDDARIGAVLACLQAVAATRPPAGLPRADDDHLELRQGWDEVERDPTTFLALGLCSPEWLRTHLATLLEAAHAAPLSGDALLHLDVRSDNVCFRADGSAVLVDWNWTSIGNPEIDAAFWLPSLESEGGPKPDAVLPEVSPELAACWAGYLGSHAAREPIPTAPHVRGVQLRQARSALPWAARRLGIPPTV